MRPTFLGRGKRFTFSSLRPQFLGSFSSESRPFKFIARASRPSCADLPKDPLVDKKSMFAAMTTAISFTASEPTNRTMRVAASGRTTTLTATTLPSASRASRFLWSKSLLPKAVRRLIDRRSATPRRHPRSARTSCSACRYAFCDLFLQTCDVSGDDQTCPPQRNRPIRSTPASAARSSTFPGRLS